MSNLALNAIAGFANPNGGWLTVIGIFMYLFYAVVVTIRLILKANLGKTFDKAQQFLGAAIVVTIVLALVFVDPANTQNVGKGLFLFVAWLGSLFSVWVALTRLEQLALHNR